MAQTVKNLPAMRETWVRSLGREETLEQGMATPLQCSCPEKPRGQRSLVGYSPWGHKESGTTERLSTHPGLVVPAHHPDPPPTCSDPSGSPTPRLWGFHTDDRRRETLGGVRAAGHLGVASPSGGGGLWLSSWTEAVWGPEARRAQFQGGCAGLDSDPPGFKSHQCPPAPASQARLSQHSCSRTLSGPSVKWARHAPPGVTRTE